MRFTLFILASPLLMMLTSRAVSAEGLTNYLCDSNRNSICIHTPDGAQTFPELGVTKFFICQAAHTYGICCFGPPGKPVPMNLAMGKSCVAAGTY
ncbi:hypothetical protein MJO28_007236 [Puccinia striiformis f. sp. tritici]|uniref:Uncharacterized protein n=4 Tax=Puccinia striiformis TaxID=27350 RepID=A0A2S4W8I2_9BASI|nr:hypothetical protein MJO28_007236 [Puccinia striiformis f. sp. tritici]KAI7955787.1 hypothetical protein MJO29_007186 [Puccinia striiformis f. sp. tritici]KAI9603721.1 hypothetical protein H4Q26_003320 [Puccinia striiformis f. sp. tritici PST-130]KAI9613618.1 hypothetical protein KEM48_003746 [Puccinia striiformis f. sp. tritici PST-130]POW17997.1 hypothetical protein PSTT_00183 [Puccinia striiformis]